MLALAELVVGVGSSGAGESGLMVDVEEDLPKPLVRGAKCVSLSSVIRSALSSQDASYDPATVSLI